ncbi:MAG: 1-deoxy-D-xylulose-5-phosphate synthase [Dehalococcoidales bacterium]
MSRLLDKINAPADVKALKQEELKALAAEIRDELVSRVAINGGHLASNLGVVELTIALHRVFDSPEDKIIWDVGHQSYTHKLLTGRRQRFDSLRQYGGLSGFTSRDESPCDPFGAGHASTSVSAALGMAKARDLAGEDYQVVAVIGDGAITGGMALEAFNHTGHLGSKLIVILNDNGMSISPTIGSLSKMLGRVRFNRSYYRASEESKKVLTSLSLGNKIWQAGQQIKSGVKSLVMPTVLWEELGFAYMGPFDGHNIVELESALEKAGTYSHKPVLLHIVTTKGKGYAPAEGNAVDFHGVSPKKPSKANGAAKMTTYSQVFGQTIHRLVKDDPKLVVITPAMPEGYCLGAVMEEFPERVFDVGICEQHGVTFAAGLAGQGFVPVVAIYSTFLQRAFDQIVHDVCLQELPVVFAIDRGGIVGDDGKTHQGTFDLSYLSLIPNLVVAAPKDENELQHLLYTAVKSGRPMAVRYPRSSVLEVAMDSEFRAIPIGKGEVLRDGADIAILAVGATVAPALVAADILAAQGIEATVVNSRFVKPLDSQLILDVAGRVNSLVTVEENVLCGGFGSTVVSLLAEAGLNLKVKNLAIADEFVEHGTQAILRAKYNLDAEGIARESISLLSQNGQGSLSTSACQTTSDQL